MPVNGYVIVRFLGDNALPTL